MPVARPAGSTPPSASALASLSAALAAGLRTDEAARALYATDASDYRELPLAVALPMDETEVRALVLFAREHGTSLIPRTAGTSLAGQVVGPGIVADVSRHMTQILEIDASRSRVRVQPGVVRNELNLALAPYGLCFGPETATQNRAMIGGMVGNNSCGSNSLVYGTTRDHLLGARAVLSDGSTAEFGPLAPEEFRAKGAGPALENALYRQADALLGDAAVRNEIERQFPKKSIHRRCMGYALDSLAACEPFTPGGGPFNFCRMLAGSEGTLAFLTEITLACVPLPPRDTVLVCVHCASIGESLQANLVALRHSPRSSELLDRYILDCTKTNLEQSRNRFFIEGDPDAMLVVEFGAGSLVEAEAAAGRFEADLRSAGLGCLC
jgi:FAD/FMN-containing dehydrogenase